MRGELQSLLVFPTDWSTSHEFARRAVHLTRRAFKESADLTQVRSEEIIQPKTHPRASAKRKRAPPALVRRGLGFRVPWVGGAEFGTLTRLQPTRRSTSIREFPQKGGSPAGLKNRRGFCSGPSVWGTEIGGNPIHRSCQATTRQYASAVK
jgi:hypothetical protein